MAIKFNKDNKVVESRTTKTGKWCSITLAIQIVLTFILGCIAFAPFLSAVGGLILGTVLVIAAVVITAFTAGIIWASKGVRTFFRKGFQVAGEALDSPEGIKSFLKPYIVYIAVSIFVVSLVGFVYNLIYFIKHDKANKGRFITSCIFLGLALINLIVSLVIYLTNK